MSMMFLSIIPQQELRVETQYNSCRDSVGIKKSRDEKLELVTFSFSFQIFALLPPWACRL